MNKRLISYLLPIAIFGLFLSQPGTAKADALGDVHSFNVDSTYDINGSASINATERAVGQNAYFYVDDRYWNSLNSNQRSHFMDALTGLVNDFDSTIYPRSVALWGSEPRPGIDGDDRITILMENMLPGDGGYFRTANEYPTAVATASNEREMLYLNSVSLFDGTARDYLAHEFQHLISFNQKELTQHVSDDIWLNEARSEYNVTNVGYNDVFLNSSLYRREVSFLKEPSDSLVEWPNVTTDYAIADTFITYVADRFGAAVVADTEHTRDAGVVALSDTLTANGYSESFTDVFTDWMVASYLNDPSVGSQYQYARPGLQSIHVTPQRVATIQNTSTLTIRMMSKEWQPVWLQFDISPNIQTSSQAMVVKIPISYQWSGALIGNYSDGHHKIARLDSQDTASLPLTDNGVSLTSMVLAYTQVDLSAVGTRNIQSVPADISVSLGDLSLPVEQISSTGLKDGDLIRRIGQNEIYVIWGNYRRYLTTDTLVLYGFQDRPVTPVSSDIFFSYKPSNYIRAIDQEKVYAIWPDGTKHWLNMTPTQWDTSGRDWNAIFIVNGAEVNSYATGLDITQ